MSRFVITAFVTIANSILLLSCGNLCGNDIKKEVVSFDGNYKAIAYIRDCGATTSFSPHISILKAKGKINNSSTGNAFQGYGSDEIDIKWKDKDTLIVIHNCSDPWVELDSNKTNGFRIEKKYMAIMPISQ